MAQATAISSVHKLHHSSEYALFQKLKKKPLSPRAAAARCGLYREKGEGGGREAAGMEGGGVGERRAGGNNERSGRGKY